MSISPGRTQGLREAFRFLVIGLAVLATAVAIERSTVPDIVPIAFAESPQPLWAIELSFLLRAIALIAGSVSLFALGAIIAIAIRSVALSSAQRLTTLHRQFRI